MYDVVYTTQQGTLATACHRAERRSVRGGGFVPKWQRNEAYDRSKV